MGPNGLKKYVCFKHTTPNKNSQTKCQLFGVFFGGHAQVGVSQKGGALLKLQSGHLGVVGGFGVKTGYS